MSMTFIRNRENAEKNRARERTRKNIEKNRKRSEKDKNEQFCDANEVRENDRSRRVIFKICFKIQISLMLSRNSNARHCLTLHY